MVPLDDEIDMLSPCLSSSQLRFMMFKYLLSTLRTLLDISIKVIRIYSIFSFIYPVYTTAAKVSFKNLHFLSKFTMIGLGFI